MNSDYAGECRRIALFHASWPLQIHTVNLAKALVSSGYGVDLYLYDVDVSFVDGFSTGDSTFATHAWAARGSTEAPGHSGSVRSSVKGALKRTPLMGRLLKSVKANAREMREWLLLRLGSRRGLIPPQVLSQVIASVTSGHYVALVGIEKLGLIWAAEVSRATEVPFAYYSLELHTRDHPTYALSARGRRIKRFEAISHKAAAATIVQDERRARVLLTDNSVETTRLIFLPVSVPGPPRPSRTRFLHQSLGLQDEAEVVLQLGMITESRLSMELARTTRFFPPECVLVMHGQGSRSSLEAVVEADVTNRVVLSLELVSAARLPELIASAAVGLVLYAADCENERLTAKSSEKLALFLRSGIPIVAFTYPGYEVIREYQCGVLIDELPELPAAVARVLANRETYSANALRCFADVYDFSRLVLPVVQTLGQLRGQGADDS